jgi:DNA-binding response OmpR family regulator
MQRTAILLIDDETAITDQLGPFLERSGFDVRIAADGEAGYAALKAHAPSLIVMDVMMPRLNGRDLLRRLRAEANWTPVIMLTQVGESGERSMALGEGADDYLNKPFDPNELVARINAILRRAQRGAKSLNASNTLRSGDLVLDRGARIARVAGNDALLTPKAVAVLEYMMLHPNELLTRERLLDAVWGWEHPAGTRTVDTRIAEIRRALNDDPDQPRYIETAPAQGYRFVGDISGEA